MRAPRGRERGSEFSGQTPLVGHHEADKIFDVLRSLDGSTTRFLAALLGKQLKSRVILQAQRPAAGALSPAVRARMNAATDDTVPPCANSSSERAPAPTPSSAPPTSYDIDEDRYSTPALTTIFPDKRQIAETAVDRLLARARSKTDLPANDTGFTLNVRESTMGRTSPA
ncbi:hypothetical protein [Nonomuraea sp. NPDC049504]|uniref:hypothetical protein n=1 Tax=Nonomuraea sp. NPDC049504 TaxID=3154729 RepID=UPI003443DF62